jgi:hypothetical protein
VKRRVRTPERLAMMKADYPHAVCAETMLAKLNALPGPPIKSVPAMRTWAYKLRLQKTPGALAQLVAATCVENLRKAHEWQRARPPGKRSKGGGANKKAEQPPRAPKPAKVKAIPPPKAVAAPPPPPPPPPLAAPLAVEPSPELADAAALARTKRVKEAIERAVKGGQLPWQSVTGIATRYGVQPHKVLMLFGQIRNGAK